MILRQSQVPHAWRTTIAYLAVAVWACLLVYWLMDGPVMHLIRLPWWGDYPTGPISG